MFFSAFPPLEYSFRYSYNGPLTEGREVMTNEMKGNRIIKEKMGKDNVKELKGNERKGRERRE